ncbi:hypothetical protein EB796_004845 [Bugula neritina]|uniref:Tc1-like transposase DDE domain-containing protein n=1 Tax=Bugula neritina TaxID=10212 RepID=A0A7J7KDY3_BUGNE|nr:hypothetical protein EB796_004845 [Bugula neritina]
MSQGTTVNSENYCELLTVDEQDIKSKIRSLQAEVVMLNQDNASPHTAARTMAKIEELSWEVLVHPPYSPDLTSNDSYFWTIKVPHEKQALH